MKVIIIGSGIAGITFAEKFRELSPEAQITILTKENEGYYSRPMLSFGFSYEDIEKSIIIKSFNELLENNICVISGVKVNRINPNKKRVYVESNDGIESLHYDKLILAMGSAAFIPPPFLPYQTHFFLFNSLADLKKLRKLRQVFLEKHNHPSWAIIGGGLIGCEIASDLAISGDQVSLFHAMDRLMERQLVEQDSTSLLNVMHESAIDVFLNQQVKGFENKNGKMIVNANNTQTEVDGIIVACGFKPRIELALTAGLETGRGIKTKQTLQTSDEHIYALGDIAELPNGKLYAFIKPIRQQALWLAAYLNQQESSQWTPPEFNPSAKVNNFEAAHPYIF